MLILVLLTLVHDMDDMDHGLDGESTMQKRMNATSFSTILSN